MNGSEGSSALTGAQQQTTTMNYESIYPDAHENSNNSGTTLKEHDYIGLSEVSSANSSNDKQPEKSLRETLDLNESATALCLGLKPTEKTDDQESMTFGNVRAVLEPAADGSKLDGSVAKNVTENPAKRAAYHHQQDGRDSVPEPEFGRGSLNPILQEFRKVQAEKAAQHHPHMKLGHVNRPMHHRPQEYEAGQTSRFHTSLYPHNAYPAVKNNGVKRMFSEAGLSCPNGVAREGHGDVNRGEGMCGSEQQDVKVKTQPAGKPRMGGQPLGNNMSTWNSPGMTNPFRRTAFNNNVQDAGDSCKKVGSEAKKHSPSEAESPANDQPSSNAQAVGWPPVKNFVRNNIMKPLPPPSAPAPACPPVQGKGASASTTTNSWYVKIYMDGVPFGRKVDLKTNNSYEKLYPALEEMFQQFINGQYSSSRTSSSAESHFVSSNRKLNFLDGSEYVLIYEDHEGDFMLVGDVPWELFINAVKRLRIMKGSEEVNLAPKNADPMKTQAAVVGR